MSKRDLLIDEIRHAPDNLLDEVIDFVRFLKSKEERSEARNTALASEAVLAREWLLPEEDIAWRDL